MAKHSKNTQSLFKPGIKTFTVNVHSRAQRPDARYMALGTIRRAMLKTRYKNTNYDPLPTCRFCGGAGESRAPGKRAVYKPCICLFVKHDEIEVVISALENAVNNPEEIAKLQAWAGVQAWQEVK